MPPTFGCEVGLYWTDLTTAGLITPNITTAYTTTTAAIPLNTVPDYLPKTRLRNSVVFSVAYGNGSNYFLISDLNNNASTGGLGTGATLWCMGWGGTKSIITPIDAYIIDVKTDDGRPLTGNTYPLACQNNGSTMANAGTVSPAGAAFCVDGTVPGTATYNTRTSTTASTPACSLAVRAGF